MKKPARSIAEVTGISPDGHKYQIDKRNLPKRIGSIRELTAATRLKNKRGTVKIVHLAWL